MNLPATGAKEALARRLFQFVSNQHVSASVESDEDSTPVDVNPQPVDPQPVDPPAVATVFAAPPEHHAAAITDLVTLSMSDLRALIKEMLPNPQPAAESNALVLQLSP